MEKICEICGRSYKPLPRDFEKSRTCCKKCHSQRMNQIQTERGTRFNRDYSFMKGNQNAKGHTPVNSFANQDIRGERHPRWKPRIKFTCKNCSGEFERVPWQTRKATSTNDFCSVKCRSEYRRLFKSGENAPDYVGGPKTYRGKGWLEARAKVVERQNGNCDSCGTHIGKSLPVHHIRPFREFESIEQANDPSNLVGLCQSCHMKLEPRTYRKV